MQTAEWLEMEYEPGTPLFRLVMHEMKEKDLRKTRQFEEFNEEKWMS